MALAIFFGFLAGFGFGSSTVFARLGLQRLSPSVGTFVSVITSFLFALILALIFYVSDLFSLAALAFIWFFLYALITYPLARYFNYSAINMAGATRSTPIVATSPIFSTLIAMVLLGGRPNLLIGAGILVTVAGMALMLSERRKSAN